MVDIFGREVKKGDIIAYTTSKMCGQLLYSRSALGIVQNVLPKRQYLPDSWQYKRIVRRLKIQNIVGSNVPYYEVMEKITFHPFGPDFGVGAPKYSKNGIPLKRPQCSNSFILIDYDTLTEDWKKAYNEVKQAYKIY